MGPSEPDRSRGVGLVLSSSLPFAALAISMAGILSVAVITQAFLLIPVAFLYAAFAGAPLLVKQSRLFVLFGTATTVGVVLLGLLSFGAALLPGLLVWFAAVIAARGTYEKRVAALSIAGGIGLGVWSVLLPVLLVGPLAVGLVAVVGCGGQGASGDGVAPAPAGTFGSARPTGDATRTDPTFTTTQGPTGASTPIPRVSALELQPALDAIRSGDARRIMGALGLQNRPCQTTPVEGVGQGPACPNGVDKGTPLPALGVAGCGGYFVTGAEIVEELGRWLVGHPNLLYGVYQDEAGQIVAEYTNPVVGGLAMVVFLRPAGIAGIGAPCGDQGLTKVLPVGAVWIVGGPGS